MHEFRSTVTGEMVRKGRKALRWSEARLGREAGLSRIFIWQIERGASMTESAAERIGQALHRNGYRGGAVTVAAERARGFNALRALAAAFAPRALW